MIRLLQTTQHKSIRYIEQKYSGGPTPSVAFKVDPSIPMENFDEYEPTVVEQLIIQTNENSGDIKP